MSRLITISRQKTFRSCPRLHHLKYERLLEPVHEDRGAAGFGTLAHAGLEGWYLAHQQSVDPLVQMFEYLERDQVAGYELERARALLEGYHLRWQAEDLEVLAVEAEFRAPLINPDSGAASRTYTLAGKLDAIVRDRDGRTWIMEHKTSSEDISLGSDYWKRLRIDGQVSAYFDGAAALGFEVDGVLYDVLARPAQRPLQKTADPKYNKDGALRAGQRLTDETPEEFGDRIRAAIAEDPNRYYQRGTVVRLEQELADARWDTWHTARLIREAELSGRHIRNPDACKSYGRMCGFFSACVGEASLDDPHEFRRRESAHPELDTSNERGTDDGNSSSQ